jgi:hypothetical protein
MTLYILSAVVSFVAVFLKGFQHKNVNAGRMRSIVVFSYLMAVADVFAVSLIVRGGWTTAFSAGTGSALGMVAAIWLHDRIFKGPKQKDNNGDLQELSGSEGTSPAER